MQSLVIVLLFLLGTAALEDCKAHQFWRFTVDNVRGDRFSVMELDFKIQGKTVKPKSCKSRSNYGKGYECDQAMNGVVDRNLPKGGHPYSSLMKYGWLQYEFEFGYPFDSYEFTAPPANYESPETWSVQVSKYARGPWETIHTGTKTGAVSKFSFCKPVDISVMNRDMQECKRDLEELYVKRSEDTETVLTHPQIAAQKKAREDHLQGLLEDMEYDTRKKSEAKCEEERLATELRVNHTMELRANQSRAELAHEVSVRKAAVKHLKDQFNHAEAGWKLAMAHQRLRAQRTLNSTIDNCTMTLEEAREEAEELLQMEKDLAKNKMDRAMADARTKCHQEQQTMKTRCNGVQDRLLAEKRREVAEARELAEKLALERHGYELGKIGARCGAHSESLKNDTTEAECMKLVTEAGGEFFMLGKGPKQGQCRASETVHRFCPEGWHTDDFNFFVIDMNREETNCDDALVGKGWKLVRRTTGSSHPATDQLEGTARYGTYNKYWLSNNTFSIKFDTKVRGWNELLLTTGTCNHWMIMTKKAAVTGFYSEERDVVASHENPKPYKAQGFRREGHPEDPFLQYGLQHDPLTALYVGANYRIKGKGEGDKYDGLNVYIRKALLKKASSKASSKTAKKEVLWVNHKFDKPGHYTCDSVPASDGCFKDKKCVKEPNCPDMDGKKVKSAKSEMSVGQGTGFSNLVPILVGTNLLTALFAYRIYIQQHSHKALRASLLEEEL